MLKALIEDLKAAGFSVQGGGNAEPGSTMCREGSGGSYETVKLPHSGSVRYVICQSIYTKGLAQRNVDRTPTVQEIEAWLTTARVIIGAGF